MGGGRREAEQTRDTQSKTRTPHKVVGKYCKTLTLYIIILYTHALLFCTSEVLPKFSTYIVELLAHEIHTCMCIGAKDLSSNSKQVSQPWEPISRLHFPAI